MQPTALCQSAYGRLNWAWQFPSPTWTAPVGMDPNQARLLHGLVLLRAQPSLGAEVPPRRR